MVAELTTHRFWDVKQLIMRLPVGGTTRGGRLLREVLMQQIELENVVPLVSFVAKMKGTPKSLIKYVSQLATQLPTVNTCDLTFGNFFINLHIVTARKPRESRPGDRLMNGTRQEMSKSKCNAMARLNNAKSNQWKRFDLHGKLTNILETLSTLHGGPWQASRVLVRESSETSTCSQRSSNERHSK
jgi:hypothetical protein